MRTVGTREKYPVVAGSLSEPSQTSKNDVAPKNLRPIAKLLFDPKFDGHLKLHRRLTGDCQSIFHSDAAMKELHENFQAQVQQETGRDPS